MGELPPSNPGKSIEIQLPDGTSVWRYPIRTQLFMKGDPLVEIVAELALPHLEALRLAHPRASRVAFVVSEKAVASSQGRAFPLAEITPSKLARRLSKHVTRTPAGIGLGMPETMELALREVGGPRILLAAFAAALTKPIGLKGVFYRIAGSKARAIDGPTRGTLPPFDQCAVLGPAHPERVAAELRSKLEPEAREAGFGVAIAAIIDANDIGQNLLGSAGGDSKDLAALVQAFRDNPLGQGSQRTPLAILVW